MKILCEKKLHGIPYFYILDEAGIKKKALLKKVKSTDWYQITCAGDLNHPHKFKF